MGFSAGLPGLKWWPSCGTGSLRFGQCVKVAEVWSGRQWLELSEIGASPPALWGGVSSWVWAGPGLEDVHQNESREPRGCWEDGTALHVPKKAGRKRA